VTCQLIRARAIEIRVHLDCGSCSVCTRAPSNLQGLKLEHRQQGSSDTCTVWRCSKVWLSLNGRCASWTRIQQHHSLSDVLVRRGVSLLILSSPLSPPPAPPPAETGSLLRCDLVCCAFTTSRPLVIGAAVL